MKFIRVESHIINLSEIECFRFFDEFIYVFYRSGNESHFVFDSKEEATKVFDLIESIINEKTN